MEWNSGDYIEGTFGDFEYTNKIAAFDLDGTLIVPKSGNVHPKNKDDWKFAFDNVINVLQDYNNRGYCIIIITNQSGLKDNAKLKDWKSKLDNIVKKIDIPIKVFCSIKDDVYRKPIMGFFDIIKSNIDSVYKKSFYCGDAAGRTKEQNKNGTKKKDHNDTDYKFAINCGLNFYTPEHMFDDQENIIGNIEYPIDCDAEEEKQKYKFKPSDDPEVILMVGYSGSGKSTLVDEIVKNNKYKIISSDIDNNKSRLLKTFKNVLEHKKNIIVDNTNLTQNQRKYWLDAIDKKKYKTRAIVVNTNEELSWHNANYRAYMNNLEGNDYMCKGLIQYRTEKAKYEKVDDDEVDFIEHYTPSFPYGNKLFCKYYY